ncbi:hypothetical protein CKO15_10815 [Halorhodospira abdelmalekii]|uniref:ATP-binding protein n=1 Tax=Halorhodospira abdelmalekii TaxID=421629 RepID=UPI001904E141|nr:ATP-binding protein [Halorhodospira abdelmalekii]MBK1735760.1 hypothetical protein [Halorhodospira abdelmalekii]
MEAATGLVGRDRELRRARETLAKGANLLITGTAGIGKTALLRHLYQELAPERPCLWVAEGTAKEQALELARQTHERIGLVLPEHVVPNRYIARARREGVQWEWVKRSLGRLPARECTALAAASLAAADRPGLVFVESLEVPPSQAEQFAAVLEVAQVAAAMDELNRRQRIRKLLWRFPERERIELQPLQQEATREVVGRWLDAHPVEFEPPQVREAFVRAVEQDSSGVPAAIEGMLEQAASERTVTWKHVRAFSHEAGTRFLDMTPVVIVAVAVIIAARYIGLGANSTELYVLAGIGMGLAVAVRFFVMPMMGRKN